MRSEHPNERGVVTDHEGMDHSPFQAFGTQANAPASALNQHPEVIIAIYLGLCALVIWAAFHVRNRCHSCGSVPVRCHCT